MKSKPRIQAIFNALSSDWPVGPARVHASFPISVVSVSLLFFICGMWGVSTAELRSVALTLPVVWVFSVVVRVAAQQAALGRFARDIQCMIGPTGNFAIDYEFLPRSRLFAYAAAAQAATLGLVAIGWLVTVATMPQVAGGVQWFYLTDFRGGWSNHAIGTQIVWVNLFLAALHALPTVPFDMRAVVYAVCSSKVQTPVEPRLLRTLSGLDSHLAAVFLGVGVTLWAAETSGAASGLGWYAFLGAAIYLYVGAQWEASRAVELEQQYAPLLNATPKSRTDSASQLPGAHLDFPPGSTTDLPNSERSPQELAIQTHDFFDDAMIGTDAPVSPVRNLDIDEILRKLHREGAEGLTSDEHQALISASKSLNARRESAE